MRDDAEAEFVAFARARTPQLYRSAWVLCGDRHRAEDLVQDTLAKVYVRMTRRAGRVDNPVGYAQTALLRTFLSWRRRRSAQEPPVAVLPDPGAYDDDVALSLTLARALADLDPLDRAVLVARHLHDQPVADVARSLGLSQGAVRNRALRALRRLRAELDVPLADLLPEEHP